MTTLANLTRIQLQALCRLAERGAGGESAGTVNPQTVRAICDDANYDDARTALAALNVAAWGTPVENELLPDTFAAKALEQITFDITGYTSVGLLSVVGALERHRDNITRLITENQTAWADCATFEKAHRDVRRELEIEREHSKALESNEAHWIKELDQARAIIAEAWKALGTTPEDAATDPDTANLSDSICVSLNYEKEQRESAIEESDKTVDSLRDQLCEIGDIACKAGANENATFVERVKWLAEKI